MLQQLVIVKSAAIADVATARHRKSPQLSLMLQQLVIVKSAAIADVATTRHRKVHCYR
jgi:hypothetical protein